MRKIYLFMLLLLGANANAQLKLPRLMSDNAILQREKPLKIWGWAAPNAKVSVALRDKKYVATANSAGEWAFILPPQAAGGPFQMAIYTKKERIELKNILFGDVWFCSGQSNMVHQMQHHNVTYAQDILQANNTAIRQFLVPTATDLQYAQKDYPSETQWKVCNPENVKQFSAVAYFFAKQIYASQNVPIGIINASVGGTPIEAWTSEDGFKDSDKHLATIAKNKDEHYISSLKAKPKEQKEVLDRGWLNSPNWNDPKLTTEHWKTINVPGYWEDQGLKDLNGVVWYRKELTLPASMNEQEAMLFLGRIVDADEVYINGKKVGQTGYQYPQRRYKIDAGVLKAGKNTVVVRLSNYGGKGGFVPDKPYTLFNSKDTVDLKGTWHYRVGEVYEPTLPTPSFSAQNQPTSLYNAMVAPATNFGIKGVLWYQGESNSAQPENYLTLQKKQIIDWRKQWNEAELPFAYVQLPNFMDATFLPTESNWAAMRQAQLEALSLPHTAMAIAIDLGEWNDIHPDNKKTVGDRLALAVLKLAYQEELVSSGPIFRSAEVADGMMKLVFNHVGSGLVSHDGEPLRGFELAGDDKRYYIAKAEIKGEGILVSHPKVLHPKYVRYAWADNPDVNFYNAEGLPASPFQASLVHTNQLWQGKKAVVVLTYDDALEVHLDNVIPRLDELGIRGTFYLSGAFPGFENRIADWRKAAKNHELGNHTLFHPCDGSLPGRGWVREGNDLSKYTTAQIVREVNMTNILLQTLDGKTERTFAYTCGDTSTAEGSFISAIQSAFVAMRGTNPALNLPGNTRFDNIFCYAVDNSNAHLLKDWAEQAKKENALLVLLFHGVGGGHNLNIDLEKHHLFLDYLKENREDFMIGTMLDTVKYLQSLKSK